MRVISGSARGTKLSSIDSLSTRPTLDRVKESLFNIIHNKIPDSRVLDLFAGSGAIGIEFLSRGCQNAVFCEKSKEAAEMVKRNLERTHFVDKSEVYVQDYKKSLKAFKNKKLEFDIIFIDPPYKEDIAVEAVKQIIDLDLLSEGGIIIIETDELKREEKELEQLENVEVYDLRKYGRVHLLFLNRKE